MILIKDMNLNKALTKKPEKIESVLNNIISVKSIHLH